MNYNGNGLPNFNVIRLVMLVLTLIVCGILIFLGMKEKRTSEKLIAECTSSAEGVIENVKAYRNSDEYRYSILFTTNEGKKYRFITDKTNRIHEEGEKVTIYYDPDNTESIFSSAAPPRDGFYYFVCAGVAPIGGLALLLSFKKYYSFLGKV